MNEIYAPCMFNEAQQASMLHHETFLRYRDELNQLEAEVRGLTEKRDTYKLLSEQREGEAKSFRAELEVARKEHADLIAQLRAAKEKSKNQSQKVEELQSQISSVVSDRETHAKELKAAKLVVEVTKAYADEMVAQYKANVEAAQDQLKDTIEYVKWQSRREALGEIHARGFDLSTEVKNAKVFKVEAKKLAYPEDEEDSEGSDGSRGGEDSDGTGNEAGSGGDQAV
ncbi:uncharacterized protein [Nicotiana tomentosiformis]|uniref:uncharacterized protein n=1 Tax=Nicotiana tomentosiformis TaxID=4098 RepID=UPI00388CEBD2